MTLNKNWNYDKPGEGCIDTDNDGICDSAYSFPGGSGIDWKVYFKAYSYWNSIHKESSGWL